MMQRSTTSQVAIAQPQGRALALRAAALVTLVALITVLVLITGPTSAEYGFV